MSVKTNRPIAVLEIEADKLEWEIKIAKRMARSRGEAIPVCTVEPAKSKLREVQEAIRILKVEMVKPNWRKP